MNIAAQDTRRCGRVSRSFPSKSLLRKPNGAKGSPVFVARKLVLAHFWVAFIAFSAAILLGEWQMFVRSPLAQWVNNPEHYYRSVTAHGVVMAYVLPTLIAMGFGYAVTELALKRPLIGLKWAWIGFWLLIVGTVMAAATIALGKASVLYTFYPPMIASPFF